MARSLIDPLRAPQVTGELAAHVAALVDRIEQTAAVRADIAEGWEAFAAACGLARSGPVVAGDEAVTIAVGGLDHVDLAAGATARLGIVAPATVRRRGTTRFADPTLKLWRTGWSPIQVSRVEVTALGATVEIVIALARPTPSVVESG